jgi:hypothetical protein
MLIRLVTTLERKPVDFPTASMTDDWLCPKMSDRKPLPESRSEAVAGDPLLGPVTVFAKSDTFTFDGACETRLKIWLIHVESPALLASPPIRLAVDDSNPMDTACGGSPRCDAISLSLRESNMLKSELTLELVI